MDESREIRRSRNDGTASWGDDGGLVEGDLPQGDLNSLLAQEQISIMNAEAAGTSETFELHRSASRHTRQLINATPYPEHDPHTFAQDRIQRAGDYDDTLEALILAVEQNEQVLARQFADGRVTPKAFEHRSRSLRQDHSELANTSLINQMRMVS